MSQFHQRPVGVPQLEHNGHMGTGEETRSDSTGVVDKSSDSEPSRAGKVRKSREINKVMTTLAATLVSIMAVVISLAQYCLSRGQAEVSRKQLIVASKQAELSDLQTKIGTEQLVILKRQSSFDYAVRLQVVDGRLSTTHSSLVPEARFTYRATIQNKGLKPVEINSIILYYGKLFDRSKSAGKTGTVRRFLKPEEDVPIEVEITGKEMLEVENKYGIDECAIFMVIKYTNALGTKFEKRLLVGGFDKGNIGISVLVDSLVID
jgi:hypothetical protein